MRQFLNRIHNKKVILPDIDIQEELDFGFHRGLDKDLQVKNLVPLFFTYFYKGERYDIKIPKGHISDGTSYPFNIREAFEAEKLRAALIHDYLCFIKKYSQKFTHTFFREALKADGVSFSDRQTMFFAVRTYNRVKNWSWK